MADRVPAKGNILGSKYCLEQKRVENKVEFDYISLQYVFIQMPTLIRQTLTRKKKLQSTCAGR